MLWGSAMLGMTSSVQGLGCLCDGYSKGIHWSKRVITSNKTSINGTKNRINQSVSISPKTKWSASRREGGRHAEHDSAATWRPAAPVPNTQPLTPNLGATASSNSTAKYWWHYWKHFSSLAAAPAVNLALWSYSLAMYTEQMGASLSEVPFPPKKSCKLESVTVYVLTTG